MANARTTNSRRNCNRISRHIDDNIRSGMTPDQARREAVLKLGGIEQTVQRQRDQRAFSFF